MIPDHCKDVSMREVDFPLTREDITRNMQGKRAYTRTDHMVLRRGQETAVIKVIKAKGKELFRRVVEVELISLPEETVFLEDEEIDVLNPSDLASAYAGHEGKVVVIQGMFGHVSFVRDLSPLFLRVVDTVPPSPSKMSVLVQRALSSGFVDLPIVPIVENIDLNHLANEVSKEGVVFPCHASRMMSDKVTYFLDRVPEMDVEVELVGCQLSQRIFRSLYGREVEMVDICPWNLAPRDDTPTIVKCCKVKEGHVIDGNLIVVQWGAKVREIVDAINDYFS